MSKVIFEFSDNNVPGESPVVVNYEFDPAPVTGDETEITPAQNLGLYIAGIISGVQEHFLTNK